MYDLQQDNVRGVDEALRIINRQNLMSDLLSSMVFKDKAACQYVVRTILQRDDIIIKNVESQHAIRNVISKDVILDVYAEDTNGRKIDVEIQRVDQKNSARRTRFYRDMVDAETLQKKKDYNTLPDVYIIFISLTDIWGENETIYTVDKTIGKNRIPYDDGSHIIYVNTAVNDGSEIARMMKYFLSADPNDMSHGALSERVRYLKKPEGGQNNMYEDVKEIVNAVYARELQEHDERVAERVTKEVTEKVRRETEEEVTEKLRKEVMENTRNSAIKLAEKEFPDEEIASTLNVSIETVKNWTRAVRSAIQAPFGVIKFQ